MYDPSIEENITFQGPKMGGKNYTEEIFKFTEEQRQSASKAKIATNVDELQVLVRILVLTD